VQLVQRLSGRTGLAATAGTIYPLLSRLRALEYVKTEWRESPRGAPRRYYSLTQAGEDALRAFELEWARFQESVNLTLDEGMSDEVQA
jgi:PadR family transcriptional regulator PadR